MAQVGAVHKAQNIHSGPLFLKNGGFLDKKNGKISFFFLVKKLAGFFRNSSKILSKIENLVEGLFDVFRTLH